jgi:hypothetical protein
VRNSILVYRVLLNGVAAGALMCAIFLDSSSAVADQVPKKQQKQAAAAPVARAPAPVPRAPVQAYGALPANRAPAAVSGGYPRAMQGTAGSRTPMTTSGARVNAFGTRSGNEAFTGRPGAAGVARPVPGAGRSTAFAGRPVAAGVREAHAANGAVLRTRADGSRSDFHDPRRGMDIHHGLNGARQVSTERADHSRVFAEGRGRGYVQHPYMFHGHEFGHRTYYDHGRAYDRFYRLYPYYGRYYEVYAPVVYYPYAFYGWAYYPWAAPVAYGWGWAGSPWFGYYGAYFVPAPVYPSASLWLADYVLAVTLQSAYAAQSNSQAHALPNNADSALLHLAQLFTGLFVEPSEAAIMSAPGLSPQVKALFAAEVQGQVQAEANEARANAQNQEPDPSASGVVSLFSDNRPHVFLAGSDLDLVADSGQECAFTPGDVLQVSEAPAQGETTVDARILASKGALDARECPIASMVNVSLSDLQEMQNHLRETIDQGIAELQSKQGTGGLPAAPVQARGATVKAAFAADAPPPDANAGQDISAQASQADQAEHDVASSVASGAAAGSASTGSGSPPPTIALGQSISNVTDAFGQPSRIIDLGAKKIYVYSDMKVTFQNGKVADVQ